MHRQRWQHLDRDLKPQIPPPSKAESQSAAPPSPGAKTLSPATLTAARGYFHLRDFHACIETLEREDYSCDPEGTRLLGLALGYVSDPRAAAVLRRAVELSPNDIDLRASCLSARLRLGEIPMDLDVKSRGPLAELTAAAYWLRGRERLGRGHAAAASTAFTCAAALFASESPLETRTSRAGASYIPAAVSHLLDGDSDAAQNAFASLTRDASPELRSFANTLHSLGEELRGCGEAERREALGPLVELVTSTQLHVGFYGRPGPVDLQWSGSDLAALTGYRRMGG